MLLKEMFLSFFKIYLSSLGTIWLFVEIYNELMPQKINCSVWTPLIFALLIAIIWFLLDGFFFNGFLKKTIVLTSNAFDTKIIIKFGDLFKQDGWKAIPVNDFFDSTVDERHVSPKSLHGIVLQKFWRNHIEDWDQQVSSSLSDSEFIDNISRSSGKSKKYKIGATAITKKNNECFLCVALSKTDISTLQASASPCELYQSIIGLLKKSREVCSGSPLNIPLFGGGLSRTGIKTNIIVNVILIAIFEESKKCKITDEIRIILPKNRKEDIYLSNILKDWR